MSDPLQRIRDAAAADCVGRVVGSDLLLASDKPFIREALVSQVIGLLQQGSCALLCGPPAVGKTEIARSINQVHWTHDLHDVGGSQLRLPDAGADRSKAPPIIEVTAADLVGDVFYVAELENKMKLLFDNLRAKRAVLFVDNLHECINMGAGSNDPHNDVATLMIQHLRNGARVVATTTPEGHARLSAENPRLAQSFVRLDVPEPSAAETDEIVSIHVERLRRKGVSVSKDAALVAKALASRYFSGDVPLGATLRLLRRAGADKGTVGAGSLREAVSAELGVLPRYVEGAAPQYRELYEELSSEVFGQFEAVSEVADALVRYAAGMSEASRPIASILLAGPSGCGKTTLGLAAAKALTGSTEDAVRVDLTEYGDYAAAARLIDGSPNSLTSRLAARGAGCLLLDELEKAHPDVLRLLLQALGESRLTSQKGRTVRLDNFLVIMTTNVGSGRWQLSRSAEKIRALVLSDCAQEFPVEFRGRLTRTVVCAPLGPTEIQRIIARELTHINDLRGLVARGLQVTWSADLPSALSTLGASPTTGARGVEGVVRSLVTSQVARWLAEHPEAAGGLITVTPRFKAGELLSLIVDWVDEDGFYRSTPN